MLKHRPETLEIIKELSKRIKGSWLSFSVKSRAGLNDEDKDEQLNFLIEVSKHTDFISIHWRTLKQLYSWEADFWFIKKVKEGSLCPMPTLSEKIEVMKEHLKLMITTEFRFEKYIKVMEWYSFNQPSIEELHSLEKTINPDQAYHSIVEFRKYAFQYLKWTPCSREIKQWILQKKTYNEMLEILSLLTTK